MTEDVESLTKDLAERARKASFLLASLSPQQKNAALEKIARLLEERAVSLVEQNALDLEAAERAGLSSAIIERLRLSPERISTMAEGVRQVIALPDAILRAAAG